MELLPHKTDDDVEPLFLPYRIGYYQAALHNRRPRILYLGGTPIQRMYADYDLWCGFAAFLHRRSRLANPSLD